jgi:hypothetical protein
MSKTIAAQSLTHFRAELVKEKAKSKKLRAQVKEQKQYIDALYAVLEVEFYMYQCRLADIEYLKTGHAEIVPYP